MAANFKPMFWSKYCQTELKKDLILANWCDYQFEGELKLGSRLKIVGAVRPTIQKYVPGKDLQIESLGDNSQYLDITESDAFAFEVDDVDKAQSQAGYLETQFDEAKTALAESLPYEAVFNPMNHAVYSATKITDISIYGDL